MRDVYHVLHGPADGGIVPQVPLDDLDGKTPEISSIAPGPDEAADSLASRQQRANDMRPDESRPTRDEVYAATPRFQAKSRTMSPGCLGSSLTTDASKPECIRQFAQRGSWRDSQ